jgi:hypothetical protein
MALSLAEDVFVLLGIWLWLSHPLLMSVAVLAALLGLSWVTVKAVKFLRRRLHCARPAAVRCDVVPRSAMRIGLRGRSQKEGGRCRERS